MALITCPECSGTISDKAYTCPHCGYPLQGKVFIPPVVKRTAKRRPNGSGTIVYRKGNYRNPYQVRVNTRIDARGYPKFDVLGNSPDRVTASIELAEFNKNPFDPANRKKTFAQVFYAWYQWKYKQPVDSSEKKNSSQYCCTAAFKKCSVLHTRVMSEIRSVELQEILDREDLSHSMLEHIKNLFNQMYSFALQFEIVSKNCSDFVSISKEDDTESGIPFTDEELALLWANKDKPFVDTILIYCYSGWRINELARMPVKDIDLDDQTFTGGIE